MANLFTHNQILMILVPSKKQKSITIDNMVQYKAIEGK